MAVVGIDAESRFTAGLIHRDRIDEPFHAAWVFRQKMLNIFEPVANGFFLILFARM